MTAKPTYTVADILALKPCYTEYEVKKAFGRDKSLTLQQILNKKSVPVRDRLWVAWRLLAPAQRHAAIERVVTRAVRQYALPHEKTSTWAENWLSGLDRTENAAWAAEAAARAAAEAAWADARADARAAAWAAADAAAAAWAAAAACCCSAAARAAAAAAWAAEAVARACEYGRQLKDIEAVLACD